MSGTSRDVHDFSLLCKEDRLHKRRCVYCTDVLWPSTLLVLCSDYIGTLCVKPSIGFVKALTHTHDSAFLTIIEVSIEVYAWHAVHVTQEFTCYYNFMDV